MSRQIDSDRIESGDLTVDEVIYLQDRNILPDHIIPVQLKYSEGGTYEDPEEDEDGEEDEDYGEGWSNETRRAELTNRGLSVDGKKDELIARLLRSDADELEEGDTVTNQE